MRFRSPLLYPFTPWCAPLAPHPALALLPFAFVSTQPLPLQVSARPWLGVVPRACMRRRHRRASLKVGPAQRPRTRTAPLPCSCPPLEAEEDPLSYQDLCRADTPWRYLALTEASPHSTAPTAPTPTATPTARPRPRRLRNPFLTNDADLLMRHGTPVAGFLTVAAPAQHTHAPCTHTAVAVCRPMMIHTKQDIFRLTAP